MRILGPSSIMLLEQDDKRANKALANRNWIIVFIRTCCQINKYDTK